LSRALGRGPQGHHKQCFQFGAAAKRVVTTTRKLPSHKVYAGTKGRWRNFRQEIGVAWAHRNGEHLNLTLDMLPLNGAKIILRKPRAEASEVLTMKAHAISTGTRPQADQRVERFGKNSLGCRDSLANKAKLP